MPNILVQLLTVSSVATKTNEKWGANAPRKPSQFAHFRAQPVTWLSLLLADSNNGRTYASLQRLSSVTLCILAKRCVLEQKLLLTASVICEESIDTKMNDLHQCSEFRDLDTRFKRITNWKWHMGIEWRHVIPKVQTRDINMLRVQYLEYSWRCNLAMIAYY